MARGRHRRRRRGVALRALLGGTALALTGAATVISVSQATDDTPGGLQRLPAATGPTLREEAVPWPRLDALADRLGGAVPLRTVLREAEHTMPGGDDCADEGSLPAEPAAARSYCWDKADARDEDWAPVSVAAPADSDRRWGEDPVIVSAWTRTEDADGPGSARVAFVDAGDPDRLTYTWGLLALPTPQAEDGLGEGYRPLGAELRGIVWYQDKLLATVGGPGGGETLHVFSLDRVHRAEGTRADDGSRFVLPAVASYRLRGAGCSEGDDNSACLGALSVDRSTSPDTLVAAERRDEGRSRLWRYTFSGYQGREGLLSVDGSGFARPVESYRTEATGIRGVVAHRPEGAAEDRWYLAADPREAQGGRGALWAQSAGERTARAARCGDYDLPFCWAAGARGLAYRSGTGELWGVADAAGDGERTLFAVPLRAVDASLE
ncbi:hypothetical protein ABT026_28570 [Streptomyces sp. NPDC002734]|uniref:hypothetical protein n=1 Tax=Streptomyces sp. NPDC002734 TaxID=3154426 RepID=UPI003332F80B